MIRRGLRAVIVANGDLPTHKVPLAVLKNAEYIVCTDGAANDFIASGGRPDAIVGDCDSISAENRERFADILHRYEEQEHNDLTKSVNFCYEQGIEDIVIVGGTGKREDHTLGNISLLAEYVNFVSVVMITDRGIFTPIKETHTFESFEGEQVSIFSIDRQEITTHNLEYPIDGRILTNWWQGTLNSSLGDNFTIETNGGRVIVFQVFGDA
ncbi:MAG: thiamine diphosphokinase [Fermentimonas sp.]|jgi:thiamine pyrophosphokinase